MDTAHILNLAANSALRHYNWPGRGQAPVGYIKGMALTFAQVYEKWKLGNSAALVMAQANTGNDHNDALSWYNSNFHSLGLSNATAGSDTLRHLFVLLIGLGMRESSGNCFEGRDASASNTSSETAEAGLFQQSHNSFGASPELAKLMAAYEANPMWGNLAVFREGLAGGPSQNYGGGTGAAFQRLCKISPAFAVEAAAVGLRTIRTHWGPINHKGTEQGAELRIEADHLLFAVQAEVDATTAPSVPAQPRPVPAPAPAPAGGNIFWAGFPPKPSFGPLVSNAARGAVFGEFKYVSAPSSDNAERVRILGGWQETNITFVPIPQMARHNLGEPGVKGGMLFHRLGKAQLLGMWDAWDKAGLVGRVLEFDGSFAPRFVRGSRVNLSNHAFGSAFDINYQWNQLGNVPAAVGAHGSVRELVPIANAWGFFWGGHYEGRKDGMHFELAKLLPAAPVVVQVPAPRPTVVPAPPVAPAPPPVIVAPPKPPAPTPVPAPKPAPAPVPRPAPQPMPWWQALLQALFNRKKG